MCGWVWYLHSAYVVCVATCEMKWLNHFPVSHPTPPTPSDFTHASPLSSLPSLHPLMSTHSCPPTYVHPLFALQVSRPTDGDHLSLLTHSS